MKFILGLVTGVAIGAAAASAAGQSGQDLRREFDRLRADLEKRDFDAIGRHLETRFKELQAILEERTGEAADAAEDALKEAQDAVDDSTTDRSGEPAKA